MRTPTEWAELFSASLQSKNPLTIELVVTLAAEEAREDERQKFMHEITRVHDHLPEWAVHSRHVIVQLCGHLKEIAGI